MFSFGPGPKDAEESFLTKSKFRSRVTTPAANTQNGNDGLALEFQQPDSGYPEADPDPDRKEKTSDIWNQFLPRHRTPWKISQTRFQLTARSCLESPAAALLRGSLAGRAVQ